MTQNTEALDAQIAAANTQWAEVALALQKGIRTLLWGPPGTGKSYAGINSALSISRCYLTLDTPAAEVRGHYVPSDSGGFRWHDGPATVAWRRGGRLQVEEIDQASGDTLTLLLGYLDDPESAQLTLPNNELIKPAAGFSCVATTNQLPSVLSDALLDRFDAVINVTLPNPKAFEAKWAHEGLRDAAKRVVYLNDASVRGKGGRPIGLRAFRSIDRFIASGVPLADAAQLVVGADASRWLVSAITLSDAA